MSGRDANQLAECFEAALARAEAAEAALAALNDKHEHLLSEYNYESYRGDHLVYAAEWDEFNEWQRNGKQALATTRQALTGLAKELASEPGQLCWCPDWYLQRYSGVGRDPGHHHETCRFARRALADTGGDTKEPA